MAPPRVAVLPSGGPYAEAVAVAIEAGGGVVAEPADADALVWTATGMDPQATAAALGDVLRRHPGLRWIQLPWAGVEQYADAKLIDPEHVWTSARGAYAKAVAEHALTLTLACLRDVKAFGRADRWMAQAGRTLFDARVTIFGGGGIARELLGLLGPFGCRVTVVRKRLEPIDGVRVVGWNGRREALRGADAVIVALALTPETAQFLGRRQFEAMERHACLINVARGRHVVTDDLVTALTSGEIAAAGLDVTDPEPLPAGHPLWSLDNCLITPHTANTEAMAVPVLAARVAENVWRFASGEPLEGVVDPVLGY